MAGGPNGEDGDPPANLAAHGIGVTVEVELRQEVDAV